MGWMFERAGCEHWYTCDDEYDTREEAIEAGREWFREEEPDVDCFDVGLKKEPMIPKLHSYHILDCLQDDMFEQCGEIAEGWLDKVSVHEKLELESKVHKVIQQWVKESGNVPNFYSIVNIETVEVNPES